MQINLTETNHGAVRGLHGEDMYKLVAIASGRRENAEASAREFDILVVADSWREAVLQRARLLRRGLERRV